jgi:uroporphyrinogen-III synthase
MTAPLPVLLMTRPEAASAAFVDALRADTGGGFATIVSPLIGISITGPLPEMTGMRGVIFSSANAVQAFAALGGVAGLACFTVGESTAEAARDLGFDPVSADGDAAALVALVIAHRAAGPLIHLHGVHSRGAVGENLNSAGVETFSAVIYDQPLQDLTVEARSALDGAGPVIVPLFSPRTAAQFARVATRFGAAWVAAMSPAVREALGPQEPERLVVAARPTGSEMRKLVAMLMDEARTLEARDSAQ